MGLRPTTVLKKFNDVKKKKHKEREREREKRKTEKYISRLYKLH